MRKKFSSEIWLYPFIFSHFFPLYNPRTIQICAKGLIMETKAQKTTPGECINFPAKFNIKRILLLAPVFLFSSLFKPGV